MNREDPCSLDPRRLLALAVALFPVPAVADELLPLQPGMTVVSCFPDFVGGVPDPPWVLAVFDTRAPECVPEALLGEHWAAPADHNELPNPTMSAADEWSIENLGPAFGVALDAADPPNIYVTNCRCYNSYGVADGRVSRIDGTTGAITVLAELVTHEEAGLGNVAHDPVHDQLLVTNLDDGIVYRLAMDGTILQEYDPFTPDDGRLGLAPYEERIWGIATDGRTAYFGTWRQDLSGGLLVENGVHGVTVDPSGALVGPAVELFRLPVHPRQGGRTMPIADIALSNDGSRMLLAERTMTGAFSSAHRSRVLEYALVGATWQPSANLFSVGINDGTSFFGINAAGGVDYGECVTEPGCPEAADRVFATGDALLFGAARFAYGLQIFPNDGGFVEDGWVIDLDDEIASQDKTDIGDVETVRHPGEGDPGPAPEFEVARAGDLDECRLGVRVSWDPAVFGPGGGTYRVYRSEISCEDALARPPIASGLTDLDLLDVDTEPGGTYSYVVEAVGVPTGGACAAQPAPTTSVCIEPPVTDVADSPDLDVVWDVLRASHAGDEVTVTWAAARALLAGEHFHLLKAREDPQAPFDHVNGEGDLGRSWTETDASAALQFFDLRVADRCENLSEDEYPPGY